LRDLRIESDAGAVREEAIVHPANIDAPQDRVSGQSIDQESGRMFPIKRNRAGLGEVITGSSWYDAESCMAIRAHDAIDRFMDAAVATGNDDIFRTVANCFVYLVLEIADRATRVLLKIHTMLDKDISNARQATTTAATTGCRIDKQRNRSFSHEAAADDGWPMLQWRDPFTQNRIP
jgi:hypothetical protein